METFYFKRLWEETTGDPLTDSWGTSTFFFETNQYGDVLRQIQLYENGKKLRYDEQNLEDQFGALSGVSLDLVEFNEFKISKDEFEKEWI